MSWWDEFRKSLAESLADAQRRTSAEVGDFIEDASASGATTDADREAAFDKWVASLSPEERKDVLEAVEDQREQLEAMLVDSGYKGDVENMSFIELARLAASRGLVDLSGDGALPTSSALDAAAAAEQAGGSWTLNPLTGGITIYKDREGKEFHEYVPGGQEGRPAAIVVGEVAGDSDRGGAHPTRDQIDDAIRDGATDVKFGPDGSVIGHMPDGTTRTYPNDPLTQGLEDLESSAGDLRSITDVLDGVARRGVEDLVDGIDSALGGGGRPVGGGGAASGMGGTGGGTTPSTTTPGRTPASTTDPTKPPSGYRPPASQPGTYDPSLEPDDFDTPLRSGKPASGSTSTSTTTPAATEPNEIVERSGEQPSEGDDDDGYRPSTKTPPTDATQPASEDRDSGKAPQPQPDSDGDGIPDDEDEDTDVLEYTPAPGDEDRRDYDQDDLDRMAEAAAARAAWKDGTVVKPAEYDPEFAARMQDRKLGMIGNPGDPDQDMGTADGPAPLPPEPGDFDGPDDDTGGVGGHDLGNEDEMLNQPQGTLDPSILEDDAAPTLAPQEMVVAELDPALVRPLETSVAAEINVEGTPSIPGYHYAIGDPVSTVPPPEEEEPIAARTDTRLGGRLSIADSFRLPTKDADDDDAAG